MRAPHDEGANRGVRGAEFLFAAAVTALRLLSRLVTGVLVLAVRGYQRFLSPMFGPRCRFYPSCSAYAVTALQRHGPFRGTWLAATRLLRCHPWNPGGVDYVPEARSSSPGSGEGLHPSRDRDASHLSRHRDASHLSRHRDGQPPAVDDDQPLARR